MYKRFYKIKQSITNKQITLTSLFCHGDPLLLVVRLDDSWLGEIPDLASVELDHRNGLAHGLAIREIPSAMRYQPRDVLRPRGAALRHRAHPHVALMTKNKMEFKNEVY